MTYQTTITEKGQITIPKDIRDIFELKPFQKIIIDIEKHKKEIRLKPSRDFLEVARKIKIKNKTSVLKAREYLESSYERV